MYLTRKKFHLYGEQVNSIINLDMHWLEMYIFYIQPVF